MIGVSWCNTLNRNWER